LPVTILAEEPVSTWRCRSPGECRRSRLPRNGPRNGRQPADSVTGSSRPGRGHRRWAARRRRQPWDAASAGAVERGERRGDHVAVAARRERGRLDPGGRPIYRPRLPAQLRDPHRRPATQDGALAVRADRGGRGGDVERERSARTSTGILAIARTSHAAETAVSAARGSASGPQGVDAQHDEQRGREEHVGPAGHGSRGRARPAGPARSSRRTRSCGCATCATRPTSPGSGAARQRSVVRERIRREIGDEPLAPVGASRPPRALARSTPKHRAGCGSERMQDVRHQQDAEHRSGGGGGARPCVDRTPPDRQPRHRRRSRFTTTLA